MKTERLNLTTAEIFCKRLPERYIQTTCIEKLAIDIAPNFFKKCLKLNWWAAPCEQLL